MVKKFLQISGVIATTLLLLSAAAVLASTPLFGNRALIVRSGSMEPTIGVGDVVVVRPKASYEKGEVITFKAGPQKETIITHRITEVLEGGYRTKGDANEVADEFIVAASDILGRQLVAVPYVGTLLAFAKTKLGFALLVLIPLVIVVGSEAKVIWQEWRRGRKKELHTQPDSQSVPTLSPALAVTHIAASPLTVSRIRWTIDGVSRRLALLIMACALTSIGSSLAVYSDTAQSTGNVFAASAQFSPTPVPEETTIPEVTPDPLEGIANHIVISEIQTTAAGTGQTTQEFIELYNPTDSAIVIAGWKLNRSSSTGVSTLVNTIDTGASIAAHGYWLWAHSDFTGTGDEETSSSTLTDNNSVQLINASSVVIDQVAWGAGTGTQYVEGTAFVTNPGANQSIERKALSASTASSMTGADATKGNGFDSDNNTSDFVLRTTSQPQNSSSTTETP